MTELSGALIEQQKYSLFGVIGQFAVLSNAKRWKICHFSTKASKEAVGDAGNMLNLLRELKPMRERVIASQVQDMSSLLQRDLNDYRVAHDLIPYLMQNNSGIGFFPAVLVALMPKGFLNSNDSEAVYPRREEINSLEYKFGEFWRIKHFSSSGKKLALGSIDIYPDNTELVVLDGQHRANAFRYVTNTFLGNDSPDHSIYQGFYTGITPPNDFNAELPVTLVWFEAIDDDIPLSPNIISRKLFVDVNTNAKPVNESRNILLDDRKIAAVCTSGFYSRLATNKFDSDTLSLLYSAFDYDDGEESVISLLSPEKLFYAYSYFLLGRDECERMDWKPLRENFKTNNYVERLYRFWTGVQPDKKPTIASLRHGTYSLEMLKDLAVQTVNEKAFAAFSGFNLVQNHIHAVDWVAKNWIESQSVILKEIWTKVFCGGEGLYYSFKAAKNRDQTNPNIDNYCRGMQEIEEKICQKRAALLGLPLSDVNQAYETFSSKASLTGFLMALSKYAHDNSGWQEETAKSFIDYLNKTDINHWVKVLTALKPLVVKELAPKSWPLMRNIYLRVLQDNGGGIYFDANGPNFSYFPDYILINNEIKRLRNSYYELHGSQTEIDGGTLVGFIKNAVSVLTLTLKGCNIRDVDGLDPTKWEHYFMNLLMRERAPVDVEFLKDESHDDNDADDGSDME